MITNLQQLIQRLEELDAEGVSNVDLMDYDGIRTEIVDVEVTDLDPHTLSIRVNGEFKAF